MQYDIRNKWISSHSFSLCICYHPMVCCQSLVSLANDINLVNMLALWSQSAEWKFHCNQHMVRNGDIKLWWTIFGLIFGLLSSKSLPWMVGLVTVKLSPYQCSSLTSSIHGIVSHKAALRAMNSASVVDHAIWVCSLDFQMDEHPA